MLTAIDLWFGKKIFQPIAIKLCHWLGIDQYQLHDYCVMLGWWGIFSYTVSPGGKAGWFLIAVVGLLTAMWTAKVAQMRWSTAKTANLIPTLDRFFRLLFVYLFVDHFAQDVLYLADVIVKERTFGLRCLTLPLWVIGYYAITINDLPPAPTKEPKGKLARQKL